MRKQSLLILAVLIVPAFAIGATTDTKLVNKLKGRILLQVQQHGEAWYINPDDGKRYYMKDGAAAYQMLREFGLGITDTDLAKIPIGNLTLDAVSNNVVPETGQGSFVPKSQPGEGQYVTKNMNETIALSAISLKFNSYSEVQSVSSTLGTRMAKNGAKFVIVNVDATNTSSSQITFPYSGLQLFDSKSRNFEFYDGSIGYLNNYIEGRNLAPSITENGNLLFEVPTDTTSYGIKIGGSNATNYFIPLK